MSIPYVGECFNNSGAFLAYLDDLVFDAWRPRFVTAHHCGEPTLERWEGWQTRAAPVTDEQWMRNLAHYYANLGWSAGPHFFFTPKHYCVLSPPNKRGVHAASFNASSWGAEMVGNFDIETMTPELLHHYTRGFACLHLAMGMYPVPFELGVRGLHFHRNDPKTTKTCPGTKIDQKIFATEIVRQIEFMSRGEPPMEVVVKREPSPGQTRWPFQGAVSVPPDDVLNVRAGPSTRAPVLLTLLPESQVKVIGEAVNGTARWYYLDLPTGSDGWVAAQHIRAVS